ncbi:hypothetical protein [Rickettsiales endosymbiont of Stachyamoeba lipophora]|uniref:hypothetical protein n=1 Tax=Rickettsiales endosymbiont of Stachyamoeba lipophora TaxID=2486578 RepID=UPI000F6505E8|nr:hypothetical protein [Rickettsiales endosymbiont of Stachyamoeba lipophora]AZL15145.1 hypothetical protein EF513_01030 [Rickettsiales endosymbiont of Stachyamoeba lipophora]
MVKIELDKLNVYDFEFDDKKPDGVAPGSIVRLKEHKGKRFLTKHVSPEISDRRKKSIATGFRVENLVARIYRKIFNPHAPKTLILRDEEEVKFYSKIKKNSISLQDFLYKKPSHIKLPKTSNGKSYIPGLGRDLIASAVLGDSDCNPGNFLLIFNEEGLVTDSTRIDFGWAFDYNTAMNSGAKSTQLFNASYFDSVFCMLYFLNKRNLIMTEAKYTLYLNFVDQEEINKWLLLISSNNHEIYNLQNIVPTLTANPEDLTIFNRYHNRLSEFLFALQRIGQSSLSSKPEIAFDYSKLNEDYYPKFFEIKQYLIEISKYLRMIDLDWPTKTINRIGEYILKGEVDQIKLLLDSIKARIKVLQSKNLNLLLPRSSAQQRAYLAENQYYYFELPKQAALKKLGRLVYIIAETTNHLYSYRKNNQTIKSLLFADPYTIYAEGLEVLQEVLIPPIPQDAVNACSQSSSRVSGKSSLMKQKPAQSVKFDIDGLILVSSKESLKIAPSSKKQEVLSKHKRTYTSLVEDEKHSQLVHVRY